MQNLLDHKNQKDIIIRHPRLRPAVDDCAMAHGKFRLAPHQPGAIQPELCAQSICPGQAHAGRVGVLLDVNHQRRELYSWDGGLEYLLHLQSWIHHLEVLCVQKLRAK